MKDRFEYYLMLLKAANFGFPLLTRLYRLELDHLLDFLHHSMILQNRLTLIEFRTLQV